MENEELAKIFLETSAFLEMKQESFRSLAYKKAASSLEALDRNVRAIYQERGLPGLEEIPAIGPGLAEKIEEYLKTGRIKFYEALKKKTPVKLSELLEVEGIGPKTVGILYRRLNIRDRQELEKAALFHQIRRLAGFGEKSEKNILQAIQFLKRSQSRFLLGEILPEVRQVFDQLKALREVKNISLAGSLRRQKETIGDADILVVSQKPKRVVDFFVSRPGVVKVWNQGRTKASVRLERGYDIDLRIVPAKSFGSALQYFTGSKEHNIALRKIALEKGLKLNEYGLFRGRKLLAGRDEKSVYRALGLGYIEPELREDQGEISASLEKKLPCLVSRSDIQGDLHCHSSWNGGRNTIPELAQKAQAMGYQYLGIADHTKFLRIEKGLDERQLLVQRQEIEKLNLQNKKFRILQGCEANILNDGKLDISDDVLSRLDFVIAGVHSATKMPKGPMTERIIRAMRNPNLDILSHPTGRILQRRDEFQIDFEKLLRAARETDTVLEINSFPQRLDLKDTNIRKAKEVGVKMALNTDSHQKEHLEFIELGLGQARRGWAENKDIINCWPLENLLSFLKD